MQGASWRTPLFSNFLWILSWISWGFYVDWSESCGERSLEWIESVLEAWGKWIAQLMRCMQLYYLISHKFWNFSYFFYYYVFSLQWVRLISKCLAYDLSLIPTYGLCKLCGFPPLLMDDYQIFLWWIELNLYQIF